MDVIIVVSVYIFTSSPSSVLPIIVAVAAAVLFEFCEELGNPSNGSVCVKTF
jgi:hypothetical protein